MNAPASARWIRVLGYGGAIGLALAAVAVLTLQWRGGTSTVNAGTTTSPGVTQSLGTQAVPSTGTGTVPSTSAAPAGRPAATRLPTQSTSAPNTDPLTATSKCKASFASYTRSGDTLKVSVTKPASGLVAAYVQLKGQASPETQSFTADGTKGKHVFEFPNTPASLVQKISVGVISTVTLQNCDLT
jgi:hypothetical protein